VQDELAALADTTHAGGAKIKVIFENAYLDDAAKIRLCEICAEIGADWVKTSTGYAPSGASMADLELMRNTRPPACRSRLPEAFGISTRFWPCERSGSAAQAPRAPRPCSKIAASASVSSQSHNPSQPRRRQDIDTRKGPAQ